MVFSFYYLDLLLILREFFLILIVLFSLCFYTILERNLVKYSKGLSLYYSVSVYFIFLFNIYLVSSFSSISTYYYLFNYSITNLYGVDLFRVLLVILCIFIFYVGIAEKSSNSIKYIPFESNYIFSFVFLGIIFLLYSFDFLMIFLSLELQNFAVYLLMNIQRNKKIVVENCIKYYILGEYPQVFFCMVYH